MGPGFEPRQQGSSIRALHHSSPSCIFLFCDQNPLTEEFLKVPIAQMRRLGLLEMGAWSPCLVGASEALGTKLEPIKERGVFCSVLAMAPFSLPPAVLLCTSRN